MDDVQAIRLAKTELREAYNAGDVERVLAVFGDEFSDMTHGTASFYGAEAKAVLRHRLTGLFFRCRAQLIVTIISIAVQGDWAFDWGWHRLTVTPKKGGRSVSTRTRYLEIWSKDADGRWRIAIFLDNLDQPPQMPPREVWELMWRAKKRVTRAPRRAKRRRPALIRAAA